MKARWWNWLLIFLFVPALFLAPLLRGKFEKRISETVPPICFLSGEIRSTADTSGTSFGALNNMIRLRFDASTAAECKIEFEAYCRTRRQENPNITHSLKGYFHGPLGYSYFRILDSCLVSEIPEEDFERSNTK